MGFFKFCPIFYNISIVPDVPLLFVLFPAAYILFMVVFTIIFVLSKWLLVGKLHPKEYPVNSWWWIRFSTYLSLAEIWNYFCGIYFAGTPWLVGIHLGLGADIGKYVLMFNQIIYPDLVKIGDNTVIENEARVAHASSPDGNIVFDYISSEEQCIFGKGCVLLPGAKIQSDVKVGHLALILPNQEVTAGRWEGNPAKLKK